VGEISVAGAGGVAVKTAAVGTWGEQERSRKRKEERRMRDVMGWGMEGILTELSANYVSRINEKTSRQVPVQKVSQHLAAAANDTESIV
jgi:hypothetical protein